MKLSLLPPVLCFLQLTSMALASQAAMDLKLGGKDYLTRRPRAITTIFHPPTGSCVLRKSLTDPLNLGPCASSDPWTYTPQKFLTIKGTYYCLQAVEVSKPVKLSIICSTFDSKWEILTDSGRDHLSSTLADGSTVCLDVDRDGTVVSNLCRMQSRAEVQEDDSQWFDMITRNPSLHAGEEVLLSRLEKKQ